MLIFVVVVPKQPLGSRRAELEVAHGVTSLKIAKSTLKVRKKSTFASVIHH